MHQRRSGAVSSPVNLHCLVATISDSQKQRSEDVKRMVRSFVKALL